MDVAVDTGGTFTDCVYLRDGELQVVKVFSTPEDPGKALLDCVQSVCKGEAPAVRHGTTVGTNTLLERKGARVAFVTTAGFEDTIAIGRQARPDLYNWFATPPECLVTPELRFGIAERTAPDGKVLRRPAPREIDELVRKVLASGADSIAISLLFSFANPENERTVARALQSLGKPISISHVVLPEFREFERGSTVTVNAYLAPKVGSYLRRLSDALHKGWPGSEFDVMQSSGGIVPAPFAADRPVYTVLSGPAGGVIGAHLIAARAGFRKIVSFDMGGTSTDVSLIDTDERGPEITVGAVLSGMPIAVPMLDIHTVGAGGGSIARFDQAGMLHVGPESAGANPGPICYGRGMTPTVTDANLILGRIEPEHFLGGNTKLDVDRTRRHMEACRPAMLTLEEFALGILRLAETTMEKAIRVISIERGHDPRDFTLVAFGGAGPLHACGLAKALQIPRVLVPKLPGAFSAVGILLADAVRDYSRTVMLQAGADLEPAFDELEQLAAAGTQDTQNPGGISRSIDLRYVGQGYELNVPAGHDYLGDFHRAHQRRYGYCHETRDVEVVNVRVRKTVAADCPEFERRTEAGGDGAPALIGDRMVIFDGVKVPARMYLRDRLAAGDRIGGAAIVVEYSATTVIPPDCTARVDAYDNLLIEVPC